MAHIYRTESKCIRFWASEIPSEGFAPKRLRRTRARRVLRAPRHSANLKVTILEMLVDREAKVFRALLLIMRMHVPGLGRRGSSSVCALRDATRRNPQPRANAKDDKQRPR